MEMSYIDILEKLRKDIETDNIPREDKQNILGLLSQLESELWKYSA
jgi:hypothetical protein